MNLPKNLKDQAIAMGKALAINTNKYGEPYDNRFLMQSFLHFQGMKKYKNSFFIHVNNAFIEHKKEINKITNGR